jgi:hypothetical protein
LNGLRKAAVSLKRRVVVKEVFFAEFEAVLNKVIAIFDFASGEVQSAFV